MNKKKTSGNKNSLRFLTEGGNEKSTRNFLLNNNDFFKKNPDLLDKLNFPHTNIGENQSLLERQNINLKTKIESYERQFSSLIDIADTNEKIYINLINWIQILIKSKKISISPSLILKLLSGIFEVKLASILILKNNCNSYEEFSKYELKKEHHLTSQVECLSKVTFYQIPSLGSNSWLSFFNIDENGFLVLKDSTTKLAKFSDVQIQSGSMAAIPLKNPDFNKSLLGALIIVSDQIQKFEESKGVMFLESISEIFSSILVSNLETGKSSF